MRSRAVALTFIAALLFTLVVRGGGPIFGYLALFPLFVPLERLFALREQSVFRPGMLTDLTHFLLNNALVVVGTLAIVLVAGLPFLWLRLLDVEAMLPAAVAIPLAVVLVSLGGYWGHRLTHEVPFLWRFHSVHHSIEQMDWVASARLHPLDASFTQAFTVMPLFLLGYDAGVFGGATVFLTVLALFQHANVRLRFPGLRWIVNTPEWHHWHHATDVAARDTNFGLPVIDKVFGTAYMPRGARPTGFGVSDPVPPDGYVRQLVYPLAQRWRSRAPAVRT